MLGEVEGLILEISHFYSVCKKSSLPYPKTFSNDVELHTLAETCVKPNFHVERILWM